MLHANVLNGSFERNLNVSTYPCFAFFCTLVWGSWSPFWWIVISFRPIDLTKDTKINHKGLQIVDHMQSSGSLDRSKNTLSLLRSMTTLVKVLQNIMLVSKIVFMGVAGCLRKLSCSSKETFVCRWHIQKMPLYSICNINNVFAPVIETTQIKISIRT